MKEIVIEKDKNSYCGKYLYEDDTIHESLERYDMINALMGILKKEIKCYNFKVTFKVSDGKFLNELNIYQDGTKGKDNTFDTSGYKDEQDPA